MMLGDMQIKTLVTLGEKGKLTGYDMTKKKVHGVLAETVIMSDPYWLKIKKELLDSWLIQEIKEEGRRKPYWLTPLGACRALQHGANPELVVKNAEPMFNEMEMKAVRIYAKVAKTPRAAGYLNVIGDMMACKKNNGNLLEIALKSFPMLDPDMLPVFLEIVYDDPDVSKILKRTMGIAFEEIKKAGLAEN